MRVLFDIVHPADVLFFKRPMDVLLARGDEILVLSRKKDVACELLDGFGIPHYPISRAATGTVPLALELARRDLAVWRAIRRFQPHVMIGFGGVAIAHAGRLTGVPALSVYDSENATLQTRITWPFITHLYVPEAYGGPVPRGRTTRWPGTKELSFLHPTSFQPNHDIALSHGVAETGETFFLRVVDWRANHDIGKAGWSGEMLQDVIRHLSARGRVILSSERPLPEAFEAYRYRGPITDVHHVMGHCRMVLGESATMASEAAILGVPGLYAGRDFPGYLGDLARAGLLSEVRAAGTEAVLTAADAALSVPPEEIRNRRDAYVAQCPDWAEAVVEALAAHSA
ncbi:MAG: DUF354 domain-containing protein [Pseudomonadota bacterium]